ncbi:rRNA adenine N-6-methyltransferase family protein [soil metagenome]|jgi:phospholipid N-methyltransferase
MDTIVYLKSMIRDKNVASITPTSSFGIEKVCSKIDFSKRNVIVEYGPGTGVFSKYILDHMTSDSKLILIERNEDFISILNQSFQDPRLILYHDSAENVEALLQRSGEKKADYVISGIPFSFLPSKLRDLVVERSYACLRDGGKFLAYQTFYQLDRFLKVYLNKYFNLVYTSYCLRNAPPLRIFEAVK